MISKELCCIIVIFTLPIDANITIYILCCGVHEESKDFLVKMRECLNGFDSAGSFWQVCFDILKSIEFRKLLNLLSSLRQFDLVYQG